MNNEILVQLGNELEMAEAEYDEFSHIIKKLSGANKFNNLHTHIEKLKEAETSIRNFKTAISIVKG